jgi:hypothetical protein
MILRGLRGPEGPLFHGDADTCEFSVSCEVVPFPFIVNGRRTTLKRLLFRGLPWLVSYLSFAHPRIRVTFNT